MALNNTRGQLTTKNTKEDTKKKAIGNGKTESARRTYLPEKLSAP
jgi:hypothetical protein